MTSKHLIHNNFSNFDRIMANFSPMELSWLTVLQHKKQGAGMSANPKWLGASPREIANSLTDFAKSSDFLSRDSQLVRKYPRKWIGVCSGEVKAAEDDLDSLLEALDEQGVPRSNTIVRYMEPKKRTLIL